MKLWQKISLANAAVLLAVVVIISALLIRQTQENMLDFTTQLVQNEQKELSLSFAETAGNYLSDKDSPLVKRTIAEYCFRQLADDYSVLAGDIGGSGIIYSKISFEPNKHLLTEKDGEQKILSKKIDGRPVLIAGSKLTLGGDDYYVYIVRDISDISRIINAMILRFILISAAGVIIGTVLIVFFVRRRWVFNATAGAVETHISDLEEKAKRQQLFIGGITHEFKTPMTSMIIHTDTLMSADLSAESAQSSLMHIHEQCRWLERLTQKLLKLITLEEDIHVKQESISELFADVSANTAEILKERAVVLKTSCEINTLGIDYDLMKSLLINLIDNASKASEPNTPVTLRAYESGAEAVFEVSDKGRGIPQNEILKITDPFYMIDRSRSKKSGGSGLGLALVKQIAGAHKAELIIESEPGKGTVVRLTLPLTKN